jgi:hypothetical protein
VVSLSRDEHSLCISQLQLDEEDTMEDTCIPECPR